MLVRRKPQRPGRTVQISIDGRTVEACASDSVAAAVLAATDGATRNNPVDASPRAPYCMMGVCFECLMTIDGKPNRQACMTPVREGMDVQPQFERRKLDL